jgi:hypothetical protein
MRRSTFQKDVTADMKPWKFANSSRPAKRYTLTVRLGRVEARDAMSMSGYLKQEDKIEWTVRTRQAQVDSAADWKRQQESSTQTAIVRSTRQHTGCNGFVDYGGGPVVATHFFAQHLLAARLILA